VTMQGFRAGPSDRIRTLGRMETERKDSLAMAIDLRLTDLWAEVFELDPSKIDLELLGWFLRAAYGQGYTDALRETQRGQLCLDLGYAVPDTTA
jgi:hypothetical protein